MERSEKFRAKKNSGCKDDKVLKAFYAQDSDKLREMSKNKKRLSNGLYALSWTSMLLALGVPVHGAVKEFMTGVIFSQCVMNFESMSEQDKGKMSDFYSRYDMCVGDDPCNNILVLRDLVIGAKHLYDKDGKQLSWDSIKNEFKNIEWDSIDFESKIVKPLEKWCEILHSFGYNKERYCVCFDVVIKDLGYIFASTAFNSVINNLSQREQGKSDELAILADKSDNFKKTNNMVHSSKTSDRSRKI